MTKRILICGSRDWTDEIAIALVVKELIAMYGDDISIIHGAAPGADTLAGQVALRYELVCVSVPAKWKKQGRAAGPIRNRHMLQKCKPDLVFAFHGDIESSKGTKDMVKIANEAGVSTTIIKNYKEVLDGKSLAPVTGEPAGDTTHDKAP